MQASWLFICSSLRLDHVGFPAGFTSTKMEENNNRFLNSPRKAVIFRSLWLIEFILMCWWLWDELQLTYLPVNPVVWYSFFYLFICLLIWISGKRKTVAFIMVAIPGIVLGLMLFFLCLILVIEWIDGPIRWN